MRIWFFFQTCCCVGVFQGQSFREARKSEKWSEGYSETQVRVTHHTHSERLDCSHGNLPLSFRWFEGFNWEGLRQGSIDPPYTPTVSIPQRPCSTHVSVHTLCSSIRWMDRWTTATLTTSQRTQTAPLTKNPVGILSFSGKDRGEKNGKKKRKSKQMNRIHILSWKNMISCVILP